MKNYSCINILTPLEQTHVHIEIYIYTQVETEFDQTGVQHVHAVQYKLNAADKIIITFSTKLVTISVLALNYNTSNDLIIIMFSKVIMLQLRKHSL